MSYLATTSQTTGRIAPEQRSASRRNAGRHQIGMPVGIEPEQRSASPGIRSFCLDHWIAELLTFPVGDSFCLKLRFNLSSDIQRLMESPLSDDQKILSVPDGAFELTATVEDTQQLRWWLHGFGARVEVLAPKSLRDEFAQLADNYAAMYRRK